MKSSSFYTDSGDGFIDLLFEIGNAVPGCRCEVKPDLQSTDGRSVIVTQFYEDDTALDRMNEALLNEPRFKAYWEAYEEDQPPYLRRPFPAPGSKGGGPILP